MTSESEQLGSPAGSPAHILVLGGTGDTGRRLVASLSDSSARITLTTRSPEDSEWDDDRAGVVGWDPDKRPFSELLAQLEPVDVVINLIGAWLVGARKALVDITTDVVETLAPGTRYIHCSAVSVWGSRPGEVIDESCPTFAEQRVARLHLEAESAVERGIAAGVDGIVLRLPHIYGPNRERTIRLMRDGSFVILGTGRNQMHHLHVDDLVNVLTNLALRADVPSSLYAIVDDDDGTYGDYCDFVTAATGAIPLPFMSLSAALDGELSTVLGPHFEDRSVIEEFWRFMTSDLRIDNSKMKDELGIELAYPTYREGLPGVLDASLDASSRGTANDQENDMIAHQWEAMTNVLVEGPEFERAGEPAELMSASGEGASMRVAAFESARFRWGRLAVLESSRMDNLNVLFFPNVDVAAPMLGLEVVYNDSGHLFSAFDLVGETGPEWEALLEATAARPALAGKTTPVEGRIAALLTPSAVVLRGPEHDDEQIFGAARALLEAYLEKTSDAPSRPASEGRAEQNAYCEQLLGRPGGVDLLTSMFGSDWTRRFLDEVYYPTP